MFTNIETNNKYELFDRNRWKLFDALEETPCCDRYCCGNIRSFTIRLYDQTRACVLQMTRPLRMNSAWCLFLPINSCCLQEMTISDGAGQQLGKAVQRYTLCGPQLDLVDEKEQVFARIEGPCCVIDCCDDIAFNVFQLHPGSAPVQIGEIRKKFSLKEFVSDATNFGVTLPPNMPIRHKAVLLAATFLIDFMFFEMSGNGNQNHHHY